MKRVVNCLFSAQDVAAILARNIIESRHIDVTPGSPQTAEMLCIFGRDADDRPVVSQFRLDLTVEVESESWRGDE